MTGDPIREAVWRMQQRATQHVNNPERIVLEELVEAAEAHLAGSNSDEAWHVARARLVLALNAARNVLKAR